MTFKDMPKRHGYMFHEDCNGCSRELFICPTCRNFEVETTSLQNSHKALQNNARIKTSKAEMRELALKAQKIFLNFEKIERELDRKMEEARILDREIKRLQVQVQEELWGM